MKKIITTAIEVVLFAVVVLLSYQYGHITGGQDMAQEIADLRDQQWRALLIKEAHTSALKISQLENALSAATDRSPGWSHPDTGIAPAELRRLINVALSRAGVHSRGMEELLLYTAAIESNMGRAIYQRKGPARGIFQMEPETEKTALNYMRQREYFKPMVDRGGRDAMVFDLEYQIVTAAAHYRRHIGEAVPNWKNPDELWRLYKTYWNTSKGATTKEFADVRVRCLLPQLAKPE